VLLDLRRPYLGGAATRMALRQANPAVCCCFMTGYGGDYNFKRLLASGAAPVIEKPFLLDELASRLRTVLKARQE
jgi:DNA-binding response OmpR family regulator